MSDTKFSRPILFTAAATLACVVMSYAVTDLALGAAGVPFLPVAVYLAVGLPAVGTPVTIYPLILIYHRQRSLRLELERLVHTDMLTELPNRRGFFEFAGPLLAQRERTDARLTAMMIDVDHFKQVNDTYGHDVGDAVLKAVAATVRDAVAAANATNWTVARFGGEEFAVLIDGLVPTAVARLADRICADVRRLRHDDADRTPGTVSIGVAFRAPGVSIDRLLKAADDAVYAAKRGGRDRWAFAAGDRHARGAAAKPIPEPANDRAAAG